MIFKQDGNGSLYVEWEQAFGHKKRAWIQRKADPDTLFISTGSEATCQMRGR